MHRHAVVALGLVLGGCGAHTGPAPAPDVFAPAAEPALSTLRIALGSCYDQSDPDGTWDALGALAPDRYIAAGDNVYADVVLAGGRVRFVGEAARVEAAYATLAADPAWQRFRDAVSVWPMWDDHDYGLNDAGADLPFADASERLFLDFWGVPPNDPRRSRPGVYAADRVQVGDWSVQVLLLDTRRFRSPLERSRDQVKGLGPYAPDPDPSKTLLGEAQWAWLTARLAEPADLRLVVSGIQILPEAHRYERWGTLPHERTRLLDALRAPDVGPAILLSGDRHFGSVYRLDEPGRPTLWELTSSSLNKSFGGMPDEPAPLRQGPQVPGENVGLIDLDPVAGTVTLSLVDKQGTPATSHTVRLPPR